MADVDEERQQQVDAGSASEHSETFPQEVCLVEVAEDDKTTQNDVLFQLEVLESSDEATTFKGSKLKKSGKVSVAEEIEGQRRGSTLVMSDDYLYRLNYKNAQAKKSYLLCNQRFEQPNCYARAIYQHGLVQVTKPHNHLADPIKVEQLRMKSRCKKRVEEESTSIREIVQEEQANGSFEVHPNFLGTLAKRRKSIMPPIPTTFDQFVELLQENEDKFCNAVNDSLYFSGFITADGFSVATFTSQSYDTILDTVETVHVERMYLAVPNLFHNLCTILITVNDIVFPIAYCFMTCESEAAYSLVFTFIKQQLPSLNVNLAILDYDQRIHDAMKSAYPTVETCGGLFHYSMAVWREVQSKSLLQYYTQCRDIQLIIRMFLALPLLPPEFVDLGFSFVREKITDVETQQSSCLLEILDYLQRDWLGQLGPQTFSVANQAQRSSLEVDAYLSKLHNKLGHCTEHVWNFIDRLKAFHELEGKVFKQLYKRHTRKKYSSLIMNKKVKEVVDKLKRKKLQVPEVLTAMATLVHQPTNCAMEMYTKLYPSRTVPLLRTEINVVPMDLQPDDHGHLE